MMKKTYTVKDPINDDFAGTNIKNKPVPEDYVYIHKGIFRRITAFALYYIVAFPLVFLLTKITCREKIVGKKKLKPYRKTGYFIYGNHTRTVCDAFTPSVITFPKKAYIIANSDCVSIKGVKRIVEDLGAIPLPGNFKSAKNFRAAIKEHSERCHTIVVYPEAHIWPYYTGIRAFSDVSFRYPAEYASPAFSFTVTYRKRKFVKRPKTVVYIDGPFFAAGDDIKTKQQSLRDAVFESMTANAKKSDCEYATYVFE